MILIAYAFRALRAGHFNIDEYLSEEDD